MFFQQHTMFEHPTCGITICQEVPAPQFSYSPEFPSFPTPPRSVDSAKFENAFSTPPYTGAMDEGVVPFGWDLAPSLSDTEDDFTHESKVHCSGRNAHLSAPMSPQCRPVPTAGTAAATASLQSAFVRRPNQNNRHELSPFNLPCNVQNTVKFEVGADDEQPSTANPYTYANTILPGSNTEITAGDGTEPAADAQQLDIYRDLILRHLIQDISTTCAGLGLPTDPNHWTCEHGWRWIREMCQQFNLPPPSGHLNVNGRTLLQMSQKDFEHLTPEGGDTLYAQLQLWKTAFESYQQQQCSSSTSAMSMTAADNSLPKNWNADQTAMSSMCDPRNLPAHVFNNYPTNDQTQQVNMNSQYYNGNNFPVSETNPHFFNNTILPSPSSSEMSSSNSMHEGADDDLESQASMLGMPGQLHQMTYTPGMPGGMNVGRSDERGGLRQSGTVHLWHFIRELLDQPKQYSSCVRWVDREEGTFKIESSHHLARYWGQRKNRSQMNYDKLSRSLRQYYKKGIIQKPEKKQRLVYKFLPPYNL